METVKAKIVYGEMLLVLILAFSVQTVSPAAEEIWTKKADMPTARMLLSTCVLNGKIYAIGGSPRPDAGLSVMEEYDPVTDTWTRKADMLTPRAGLGVSAVNGKIYAIGGAPLGGRTVEEFDPGMDTWTRKADMPTARFLLSTCEVDGKIYAIGGATSTDGPAFTTVEAYDPATDTWARKADMPEPRYLHTAGVVDGKIYIIAGSWQAYTASPAVFAYDPATDTWERKADAPTARSWQSSTAGVADGRIYVIGGDFGPPDADVEEYDPATDTWTTRADMPTPRGALSTTALNGRIYVIGGTVTLFSDVLSTVEEYIPNPLLVDFNDDGIVDIKDLLRLIDFWGQNDPLCDIAPRPSGDGVVDALDLELLMSYWGQPVEDPLLVAHWALDETEGEIAYDSAGVNDAFLIGGPVWQPEGGRVGGALMLDGVDDYAFAQHGLNPANGPFSLCAWIKGGVPGQAIISQADGNGSGETWLGIDAVSGCLITGLVPPSVGRFVAQPLSSQAVITDGLWHHVGFVWDGSYRAVYVDSIEVAKDISALAPLKYSNGGFYIGTGKTLDAGTFFSGLIDDVRIYNIALTQEKIEILAQ
jgi:N-acetylneuraminic acid mutarotase